MSEPLSNRERLEKAGIIKPDLTEQQYEAIESLSPKRLISLLR